MAYNKSRQFTPLPSPLVNFKIVIAGVVKHSPEKNENFTPLRNFSPLF
jgi:hypothetical protein